MEKEPRRTIKDNIIERPYFLTKHPNYRDLRYPEQYRPLGIGADYSAFNLKRIVNLRWYMYEKEQMGLHHGLRLYARLATDAEGHILFEITGTRIRTWDKILRPGIEQFVDIIEHTIVRTADRARVRVIMSVK